MAPGRAKRLGLRLSFCRFCLEGFQRPAVLITASVHLPQIRRQEQSKTCRNLHGARSREASWTTAVLLPFLSRRLPATGSFNHSLSTPSANSTAGAVQNLLEFTWRQVARSVLDYGCPSAVFVSKASSDRQF